MKRPVVYVGVEVKALLDDISFLTKIPKMDIVDTGLMEYLNKIIKEKNLEDKIKQLREMQK